MNLRKFSGALLAIALLAGCASPPPPPPKKASADEIAAAEEDYRRCLFQGVAALDRPSMDPTTSAHLLADRCKLEADQLQSLVLKGRSASFRQGYLENAGRQQLASALKVVLAYRQES